MMSYTISEVSFDSLYDLYTDTGNKLNWRQIFLLPFWLKAWWQSYIPEAERHIFAIRRDGRPIGIAPLQIKGHSASIIGSPDVCDYLDFVTVPGYEADFTRVLLDELARSGIKSLKLSSLRPDSMVLTKLAPVAQEQGYQTTIKRNDVSLELELPGSWDEYLGMLNTKQRHEVRRKLRKLEEEIDSIEYRVIRRKDEVPGTMDIFLKLFVESRSDKAAFMTPQRESWFRTLAEVMAEAGLLRFGILKLDTKTVAMVMCFDYNGCVYLYNSGYSPEYRDLSVGILSKVLCIKDCIESGVKIFDFLKGGEAYKYYLGGKEIPLYDCEVVI